MTFTPSPYGLLAVATAATPDTPHWQHGVTYRVLCPTTYTTYDECIAVTGSGAPPEPDTKTVDDEGRYFRGATPFTVYAKFSCTPVGADDLRTTAQQALNRTAQQQIEAALWTGQAGGQEVVWPHLAADEAWYDDEVLMQSVPLTGTASDAPTALGFLEQGIADCYSGRGVIHIPRNALPTFDAAGLLRQVGGKLQTISGTSVVAGDGYPGTAPDGTDPATGQAWIYATGEIFEMHGPVRITSLTESFDRSENTVSYLAEQTWLIGWNCCHIGIPVLIGCCDSGESSSGTSILTDEYTIVNVDTVGDQLVTADTSRAHVIILPLEEDIVLAATQAGLATGAQWRVNVPVILETNDAVWAKTLTDTSDVTVIVESLP